MEEFKLYIKLPKWINIFMIIGILFIFFIGILGIILFIYSRVKYNIKDIIFMDIYNIIAFLFAIIFSIFGIYFVLQTEFGKKYYYIINKDGITLNCVNLYKKYLKWNSEIYYMLTDSFFDLYKYKNMKLLRGEIINKNNIKKGIISLKSKKCLKNQIDNSEWIYIWTRSLENNFGVNDILKIINQVRDIKIGDATVPVTPI
jgi:hypothetical protein